MPVWWVVATILVAIACGFVGAIIWSRRRKAKPFLLPVDLWNSGLQPSESTDLFLPTQIEHIPESAKRYLLWSTPAGAPIPTRARFITSGRIRPIRGTNWAPLVAHEVIQVGTAYSIESYSGRSQDFTGYDLYSPGRAERRWIKASTKRRKVVNLEGGHYEEFARWRVASSRLLIPGGLVPGPQVRWTDGDEDGASFTVIVEGKRYHFHLMIAPDGRPYKLTSRRWSDFDSPDGKWQMLPYIVRFSGVYRKDGYTLPHQFTASWGGDLTEEYAVVEMEIQDAEFQ